MHLAMPVRPIPYLLVGDGDTHHPTSLQSIHTDTKYGANFDPNYPERAYIPDVAAGNTFSYKYKLPTGLLTGDLVLLQWHYVTENSCIPEGYYEYTWPVGTYWSGPNPSNMATCGTLPLDGEGLEKMAAPEQFWNCAEIKVASNCAGVPSLPPMTSKPTPIPTLPMPTITPTQKPTATPTEKPMYTPPSPPVTSNPTSSMPKGNNEYCNWGPAGTAASSTCNLEVQGGDRFNTNKDQCEAGCSGKWCTNMMMAPATMKPTTNAPAVVAITKEPTIDHPEIPSISPTESPSTSPSASYLSHCTPI